MHFEGGLRTSKWEVDGDNSEDWVRRETVYGVDGQIVDVNTYDAWPADDPLALA